MALDLATRMARSQSGALSNGFYAEGREPGIFDAARPSDTFELSAMKAAAQAS